MARGDEDNGARERLVSIDATERREWLARPEVRRRLVSIARRRFGLFRADAEDVVHDFYRDRLFRVAELYAQDTLSLAYLDQSFRNYASTWLGTKSGALELSLEDPNTAEEIGREIADAHRPRRSDLERRVEALRRAIDRLSDADRRYVDLRFIGGLSNSQIASELGKDIGAVKVGMHRALKTLKAHTRDEAYCLALDDVADWPALESKIGEALQSDASDKSVGAFCRLLQGDGGQAICVRETGTRLDGKGRPQLLGSLNRVLRSSDLPGVLATTIDGAVILSLAACPGSAGPVHRNRLIVEVLFEPLVFKAQNIIFI